MTSFGWTEDPAILAIMEDLLLTEDEQLLGDRKCGGVHRVWAWPLGHPDHDDWGDESAPDEPIFVRVDVVHGRYLKDGCTFLVWDWEGGGEAVRPGTLPDADWLRRGVNEETYRVRKAAEQERYSNLYRRLRGAAESPSPVSTATIASYTREATPYREDAHRWKALTELLDKLAQKTVFPVPPYTLVEKP